MPQLIGNDKSPQLISETPTDQNHSPQMEADTRTHTHTLLSICMQHEDRLNVAQQKLKEKYYKTY